MSDRDEQAGATPEAYWHSTHRCWYVPVAGDLLNDDTLIAEPARVEIKDGMMWITRTNLIPVEEPEA